MSSQAPERSPLDRAKAEAIELIRKVQNDLDSIRTAPVNELETRINALKNSFEASQESAIVIVETALKSSDARISDLEQSQQALQERTSTLTSDLSAQTQAAKTQLDRVTVELASQKINHGLTQLNLKKSKSELEETSHRTAGLQRDLDAVNQQMVDLRAEMELAKRQSVDSDERLRAAEQQNADLQAHLKAATRRALTAEHELKTIQPRFRQIRDDITALASSLEQQPIVDEAVSSPSPARHGNVEESRDGPPPPQDNHTPAESLDSHMGNSTRDQKFDLLLCQSVLDEVKDKKHWPHNRHFLKPVDSAAPNVRSHLDAITHPMDLDVMTEKLATGSYESANSFKADFNIMIANCISLNPHGSLAHTAANQLSAKFEQSWSAHRISSHESLDHTSQDQESRGHKRKASTEGPVSSESDGKAKRAREDPTLNDKAVQPAEPATQESIRPHSSQSAQLSDISQSPAGVYASVWQGCLWTRRGIDVNVDLSVVAKPVHVLKPVFTQDDWKSLVPHDLRLTAYAKPVTAMAELFQLNFFESEHMTLRLEPASGTDTPAFDKLSRHLISKKRFATVSHQRHDEVTKIFLIPELPNTDSSRDFYSLQHQVLPQAQTKNTMFIVIIYYINCVHRMLVRQAWNDIIKAVHSSDMSDLAGIHHCLMRHPLPIYRPERMAVFSAEGYFASMLSDLPLCQEVTGKFAEHARSFLKLSYPKVDQSNPSNIDGVKLPQSVFILGRVIDYLGGARELLVVDIENKDRPLWMISGKGMYDRRLDTTIGLLTSKFPQSWKEWEETIDASLRDVQWSKQLKDTGLRIERF